MEHIIKKADVLIEALPYIKRFHNKITVIKYGGSILGEDKIRSSVLEDIVFLSYMGLRPVLVHGGGPNISERMKIIGKKTDFVEGMRVTDEETLNIVQEELAALNKKIVFELKELGGKVKGFSGKDNNLIQARKKKSEIDLGFVGDVSAIDAKQILEESEKSTIVVISPMGIDKNGEVFNINADDVAANVAGALSAEKLVLLTNVKGIMRNADDPHSFIAALNTNEVKGLIDEEIIQEGMIPKVGACIDALSKDVKKTHIIDARISHALLLEIFTDEGIGTEITKQ
ncbi:MAG TPA: acetylglutamate kinase [Candidatus Omnitrophica bacterium]|nr:acetylglutamate kinase [Candidatus Omnitrophota bacterium]